MKLALLNNLSNTPLPQRVVPRRVVENQARTPKREKSLLSEIREAVDSMTVVELQEHEDIGFAVPDTLHFFGIESGSSEHREMEDEFRHLSRSNPRLCRKIMHLD